ncbi:MAG: tyrosine-protein phosphatase [Bacteroidota bacterium]
MGLDYTDGCVNFRDFGAYINLILNEQVLLEGRFYRGGSVDYVKKHEEIECVKSVISLRNGPDYEQFDAEYYHFPMSNKIEKYDTTQKAVRVWLNQILRVFESDDFRFPFLIHCLSGKDRTGILTAAILMILGIDKAAIEEEYLLSEGEVKLSLIRQSIDGFGDITKYFDRVDIRKVRECLLFS